MSKHVSMEALRSDFDTYFEAVVENGMELIVTRPDREPLVVMTLSDWEGMQETLYLLGSPANARVLRESIAEADAGKLEQHDLIEP